MEGNKKKRGQTGRGGQEAIILLLLPNCLRLFLLSLSGSPLSEKVSGEKERVSVLVSQVS